MADPAGTETKSDLLINAQPEALTDIAARLQAVAVKRGCTVGTAESCTGGLVSHAITEVPGSSAYYRGGIISYSNDVKAGLLGISPTTIERHGAVSAQVAKAMAMGARDKVGVEFSVAVTGVAGPSGGSSQKPVGLTYVAAAGPHGCQVQRRIWSADRSGNKELSAAAAMELLIEVIESTEAHGPVR